MFKNALTFAGAALGLVFLAPTYMPYLNQAQSGPAATAPAPQIQRANTQPMALAPAAPAASDGFREKVLREDAQGQYVVDTLLEGVSVPMLIDSGATFVMISSNVAARIGARPLEGRPRVRLQTANGYSYASPTMLKSVDLGSIYLNDVEAFIADENAGEVNLLGATFLKRLGSVEQRNGMLVMRQ